MGEYIEREAAIREVMAAKWQDGADGAMAMQIVAGASAADVAPVRHGEWLDMQDDDQREGMWRCSACGEDRYFYEGNPSEYEAKYCPVCGARMDGGADNGE